MKNRKKLFTKKQYKLLFFISLFVITLSSTLVNVRASGIEYNEEDTIFTFDLNRNYLDFISNNFPQDFSYYFTLPISFTIGNFDTTENNLSVRIVNGSVQNIWFESLSNLGTPYDVYLVENGSWNDTDLSTDVAFAEGIKISETYINDLYNYNFQMNDNRDYNNYINRFYQYLAINNLLTIKLNTYRFKNNIAEVVENYDNILYNISQVYVDLSDFNSKIIGYTIGGTLLNENGEILNIPIPKISFMSNNEKYNELEFVTDIENNDVVSSSLKYNNFEPYNFEISSNWTNNNYKFLTLYNNIGIMDYLNLSIYGEFNVSQYWVDPDIDSTFNDLFSGIANIPIIILSNLLSFSVFGWTAFAVLTGIITLLVLIWLIRKLTR